MIRCHISLKMTPKMQTNKIIRNIFIICALIGALSYYASAAKAMPPPRSFKWFTFGSNGPGGGGTIGDGTEQILLYRDTYSSSARTKKESTFENGETVYVRLAVYFNNSRSEKIKVIDDLTNADFNSIKSPNTFVVGDDNGGGSRRVVFELNGVNKGVNIIDYEYKAND
jgi:hypothetical protein